jgi:hypothetical protein
MRHSIWKLGLPLLAAIVAGCANMGTGRGSADSSASLVNFSLKNSGAVSASMNTAVPDEKPSSGQFF